MEIFKPDINNLMDYLNNIAKYERVAGTKDEEDSFRYIKKVLDQMGMDTVLHHHDAFISIPESASLEIEGEKYYCQTHSMVKSHPQGIEAEFVFIENNQELDMVDYENKFVVLSGHVKAFKIVTAQKKGARGVIFVPGSYIYESCISPVWGSPSMEDLDKLPQIPVISITKDTWDEIRSLNEKNLKALIKTVVDTGWRKIPLLVAEAKSDINTDKFVMFSGHVDSWYKGAMDNGTANSVMMETARIVLANADKLKNNLRLVFFSGHSQGRYAGSTWYSDNFWEDIHRNCILSVNIDSVGARGADDLTRSTSMAETRELLREVIKRTTGVDYVGRRYARFADQSFWGTGTSCALASFSKQISELETNNGKEAKPSGGSFDLGWWWHTPHDTVDKIDTDNLLRDATIFATYIMYLLSTRVSTLNFVEAAHEILEILEKYQLEAGDCFDLSQAIAKTQEIISKLDRLYRMKPNDNADENVIEIFNRCIWKIGRELIPLNYTRGKLFKNDEALPLGAVPVLDDIKLLKDSNEDVRKSIIVELTRKRNYVMHKLINTLGAIDLFEGSYVLMGKDKKRME